MNDQNQGRFVWHDLMTTDPAAAERFYTELCGWNVNIVEMGEAFGQYRMLHREGESFGGICQLDPNAGAPSHWIAYVAVDDVEAASQRAANAGGKVCVPPTPIPEIGKFAVIQDPTGGHISAFEGASGEYPPEPPADQPAPVNSICWNELLTTDPDAAAAFYGEVFGWTHQVGMEMEEGTYHMFMRGDRMTAGFMQKPPDTPGPSHWLSYIEVDDVDARTEQLQDLGGQSLITHDIPNIGRFSVNCDPTGAVIALFTHAGACE